MFTVRDTSRPLPIRPPDPSAFSNTPDKPARSLLRVAAWIALGAIEIVVVWLLASRSLTPQAPAPANLSVAALSPTLPAEAVVPTAVTPEPPTIIPSGVVTATLTPTSKVAVPRNTDGARPDQCDHSGSVDHCNADAVAAYLDTEHQNHTRGRADSQLSHRQLPRPPRGCLPHQPRHRPRLSRRRLQPYRPRRSSPA